ncbi:MAG: Ig-like domain repeat protein [Methanobrevibacter sp.]|uniref:beta strand repeat-containing protein n=1 Tax=Methanobrevibacter sp. TaxID=66852 RepID=UPI0026DF793B|nr:Ig-like domain repeat protein [Methanobrevibacter sp.]MDO5848313.1 Ig-like domain repeat protein [Methanobrevibacter sp.]
MLCLLFSVSSVSADDNQTVDDNFAVVNLDADATTFADINSKIASSASNSVIYLNNQSFIGNGQHISIAKSITIDGSSQDNPNSVSVLDAQGNSRVFIILASATNVKVTLKNLVIVNGNISDFGGAVYSRPNSATLTISNIHFENNTATSGGAVYMSGSGSTLNVDNCSFLNNRALNSGAGAIYVYNVNANINNCNFMNNSALRTNETGYSGGAIFSYGILNVDNCLFENNSGLYGGAIINDGRVANIKNSNFTSNVVTRNSGAAIYNYDYSANLKVNNCTFEYNVANNKGSGIYNFLGTAIVENSTFVHNTANSSALLFNDGGKLNVTGSNFTGNIGTNGSVIYNTNATWGYPLPGYAVIKDSNFDYNVPVNGTEIYNGADLKLYSSNLTANYTLIQNYGTLTLEDNNLKSGEYLSIYNDNGTFTNPLKLVVLDNSTVKTNINKTVEITAILVDANNNTVGDRSFKFIVNGTAVNPTLYKNGTYKANVTFSKGGIYPVSATIDSNGDKYLLENGTVKVLSNPNLVISVDNITYGENATVNVSSSDLNSGNVQVIIKDIKTNETIYNSSNSPNTEFKLSDLNAGNYSAFVDFAGNDDYAPASNSTVFEVDKAGSDLVIEADNITFGQDLVCNVTLGNITGSVNITVNNKNYTVDLVNGKGNLTVSGLDAGDYVVSGVFPGNDNYLASNNTANVTVMKVQPSLNVTASNTTYGNSVTVNVSCDVKEGSVKVDVNGTIYDVDLADGKATLVIPNLDAGNYTVVAEFGGNNNYLNVSNSTIFEVAKIAPKLIIEVTNITYGDVAICNVYLNNKTEQNSLLKSFKLLRSNGGSSVEVTIDGKNYNVALNDGVGQIAIPDLNAGNYTALANYEGNRNYLSANNSTIFEVSKAVPKLNIQMDNVTYGNASKGIVEVTGINGDPLNGTANVTIDNKTFEVEINNGKGTVEFDSILNPGSYLANVSFVAPNYENAVNSTTFNVIPVNETGNITNETPSGPIANETNATGNVTNGTSSNVPGNETAGNQSGNVANKTMDTGLNNANRNLNNVKTANPILLMLLAMVLIPLRRKFKY